jgi:hypothetical protein
MIRCQPQQTQETLRIAMSQPAPGKGQGKGRQGKGRPSKGWMPRGASLLRHLQGMQPSSIPRLVTWDDLGRLDLNGFDEEDTGGIRILRCNQDQLGLNENDWTMKQYR